MLQFYKPNPRKTGSAIKFSCRGVSSTDYKDQKDAGLFLEIIKQTGWDNQTKSGTFSGGATTFVKFSVTEMGDMLHALQEGKPAFPLHQASGDHKTYHKSEAGGSWIGFSPYQTKSGKYMGFSLSVNRKKDGETESFLIGLTPAEMKVLEEFIKFSFGHIFNGLYSSEKKRRAAAKAKAETKKAEPKKVEPQSKEPVNSDEDESIF